MRHAFLHLRMKSLLRGTLLVLLSLAASFVLSGFPQIHRAPWIALAALAALWGSFETARCLKVRWDLYHAGVLLLLYMDLITLILIFFLLIYPYAGWLL
jgi:hypothetical protein